MRTVHSDLVVIGGGIVGLATSLALIERYPRLKLVLLEKEAEVGRHQTGHNSGVVHSGIYYRPGSLKARLCVEGVRLLQAFCNEHGLRYHRCGKVIVATSEAECEGLEQLFERGVENGVSGLRLIDRVELKELEPLAAGLGALHSPNTAIVDYREIARTMATCLGERGVQVVCGAPAMRIAAGDDGVVVETPEFRVRARYLINCAGLYADRIARMSGATPSVRIVPFRGEYYLLKPERRDLVRGLIYPVPDPELPFLGVHFTRTVGGEVEAGPNAVFAFAREGYSYRTINPAELLATLSYRGFQRLSRRYWRVGLYEYYRSMSKQAFVASLQKLVPSITADDISRGHSGVRAQAVNPEGKLLDDFVIEETDSALHVLSAPSPAATASLAIGRHLAERVETALQQLSSR